MGLLADLDLRVQVGAYIRRKDALYRVVQRTGEGVILENAYSLELEVFSSEICREEFTLVRTARREAA